MRKRWLLVVLVICVAACSGEAVPEGPTAVELETVAEAPGGVEASAGKSGCYAVKFKVSGCVPGCVVTGDLEGTREDFFDPPDTFKFAGITVKNGGRAHWTITGGTVPGLGEFDTSFDNKNFLIDRPGSPDTLFENIGKHRALDGVQKANLHYNGTFTVVPEPSVDHDFSGVICP